MSIIPGPIRERADARHKAETVLRYIIRYKGMNDGLSPSMREIMEACGIRSLSHVHLILEKLEDAGWINRDGNRGIFVVGGQWTYTAPACVRTTAVKPGRKAAGEG